MKKRGRKSAAELAVVHPLTPSAPPPDAPYHLANDEAAEVWHGIVNSLPSEFFPPESFDTLAAYCRHVVAVRFLSREVERTKLEWLKIEGGIERLNKLLAMRERECRNMLACARALRLSNQSRYRPERAGKVALLPNGRRPWEG